jgi:class 3 adenylate cyclase
MSFLETVARARAFLEHSGRISLSGLRREFDLDEDALEALVEELVDTQQVAAREGKILAWLGRGTAERSLASESIHPAGAAAPETLRQYPTEGERRHLTVMFCDLVGSTALSQQLDAEVYCEVVQAYHSCAAEPLARFDGHVGQYLGDGLLVYFGYPQAHEDDAHRAVRAARELLRALGELNPQLEAKQGVQLQARIGIHTGPVVIDEIGCGAKREMMALGDTLNIAARLESFAEPDTIVISDATLELVAGLFVTEDRGAPALKGVSDPIHAHRVLQPSGVTSRLDRSPRLTPFVGREHELGLLLDGFEHAREGQGQTLVIAGEAGIGKSRLTRRLRELLRETPHTWLECHSTPYTTGSALYPLIEMLQQVLHFGEEDETTHIDRLEKWLERESMHPAQTVPLFASLLSLQLPDRYRASEISPQAQRQQTLDALLTWLLGLAEKQPVVILTEDLHWSDPSTLEWLNLLIERCPTARLLVLLTHRPEFEPSWPSRAHIRSIVLGRLTTRQAKDLIAAAAPGTTLPDDVVAPLAARSDGVPLFAEELVKNVIESVPPENGSFSVSEIPRTLQDLLMARLDRLGDAKRVAQLGAGGGPRVG